MAELRYTYLLDLKDRASRPLAAANERIARSTAVANRAITEQGTVAASASRQVQTAGARQSAEWKQVARAAQTAERTVAQAATQASTKVSRAMERQVAAQRKAGASYAQIARQQKAAGVSARETAAAIEQSAAREQRAINSRVAGVAKTGRATSALRRQISDVKGLAGGLIATFGVLKGVEFVGDSVKDVEHLARATVKLTAITGQDATTASSWIQIAKERGISAQQLARGFVTLEKNQVKAAAGSKVQAEAFRSLGISQEELKKSNPQQLILKVADGMKNMESPAKRAAAAQALFGRAGVSLIATLSGGSQAIRDHLRVVQEYGASLDKNGVKQAMKLVAEQRKLKLAMDGVKISLGQALVPVLARGAKALATFILQMRQGTGTGGAVRRVFEQMAQGVRDLWSAVGPAVKALAGFVRQHPGLVRVAGAFVAIGVAVRALRFASAISGATSLLGLLAKIGAKRGVIAGALGGGGAGAAGGTAAAGIKTLSVRLLGLVGVYALARAAADKFTAKMTASSNPVVSAYGKVQNVVQRLGRAFMGDRQGLTDYFTALFGGASKAQAKLKQTASAAAQVAAALGKLRGRDIAQSFATEAASAGNVTVGMIRRVTASLGQLKGDARREARLSMQAMLKQLVAGGTITAAQAAKLEKAIAAKFGSLKDDLGGAARRGIRAITREFGALPGGISNPLRLSLAQTRSYMGRIISVVNVTVQQLRTMRALLAAGIEPVSPRSIGGGHRPAEGRTGGRMGPGGFRRYQAGGVVPAMVSPGEMIVHAGRAGIVPGTPVAADNVGMMLPVGAAVLTGHGQQLVSQGASIGEAIRDQMPHYAAGGWVRTGATVYNDPPPGAFGGLSNGYAELGTATRSGAGTGRGYIAPLLGRRGELPANFALDVKIHGRTKTLRKRDRGYGQGTPAYSIDIWRDSWGAFGINSSFKGPALIRPHGGTAPAATGRAAGSSRTISGLAQAMARRVGRSPTRGGLVSDAWDQGFAQGQAGMTRSVLAREGDDAFRSIAAAYRLPAAKTITTPGRPGRPVVGGRPSSRDPGAPNYGGTSGPMVTFQGKRMRLWLAKALSYARSRGWRGYVVEGLRSIAEQRRLWNGAPGNGLIRGVSVAAPGTSNHQTGNAVDVSPAGSGLQRFFRGYRGHRPIWRGPTDRPHYSWNGHRAGGWIGGVRRFQTGGLAGRPASRPSYTFATPSDRGGVLRGDQYALYNQPQGGFGSALGGAMYAAESWARGSLAGLNKALQDAADSKIAALRKGVAAAVKRGGTEAAVKRLQAALSLIDKELARRAGLIQRRIDQRATRSDQFGRSVTAGLQMAGVDPSSSQGLLAQYRVQGAGVAGLQRTGGDLQKQLALALKAGDRTAAQTFRDAIAENTVQISEGLGTLAQLARDGQAAQKAEQDALVTAVLEKRGAELQGAVDAAASGTSLAQAGLQRLGLEQQLAGTYDKGGQARGDYITQNIIPAIQAQITAMQAQQAEAQRLGATDTVRSLAEAIAGAQNDVLQAQLDAQDAIKQNTADTADSLKNLGGSLGFDFGGARFTDALIASGVGA